MIGHNLHQLVNNDHQVDETLFGCVVVIELRCNCSELIVMHGLFLLFVVVVLVASEPFFDRAFGLGVLLRAARLADEESLAATVVR